MITKSGPSAADAVYDILATRISFPPVALPCFPLDRWNL